MRKSLPAVMLLSLCTFVSVVSAQAPCTIDDDEEYAVLAAVLFPNEPDIPDGMKTDLERKAYFATATVHLNGFHGNSYFVAEETMASQDKKAAGPDRIMVEDHNRKNVQPCKMEDAKLLAHVPEGRHVTMLNAEEMRKTFSGFGKGNGWEKFRQRYPLAGGIAYLSRPGFNRNRTEAMVEAHYQAGYEMGVGYRVYLKKSPITGKWVIEDADLTRMS